MATLGFVGVGYDDLDFMEIRACSCALECSPLLRVVGRAVARHVGWSCCYGPRRRMGWHGGGDVYREREGVTIWAWNLKRVGFVEFTIHEVMRAGHY